MTYWWQQGIVYQIYPRSFQDANGDGIGDLQGVIQRLEYLEWLGIDAIWISPMYPSPMADFGYDVSNYVDVHPLFGTLADMDAVVAEAHRRNIKVLLDFVPNHSSDQHPWFIESRSSRDNPKRDWYVWRDAKPDGSPPNNWLNRFSDAPAWTWDEQTGQYYLHSYLPEQPDVNWRNDDLRAAMLDAVRFWLDRGIDGFRVDVAHRPLKDPEMRDNPPDPEWHEGMNPSDRFLETYNKNVPDIHIFNRWLREVVDEYDDCVLLGEITLPVAKLVKYYGAGDEFHLPLNFELIFQQWDAARIRVLVDEYEQALPDGAWPNWVLSNHDRQRFASRAGASQAHVGLLLLLTLRGTPTVYYGDELGMEDVPIPPDKVQDPQELNVPGLGLGRDPERTPMQWSAAPNAGFCPPNVEPWLPVADDYAQRNVAVLREQPASILTMTQQLIALRRQHVALNVGDYRPLPAPDGVLAYVRSTSDEQLVVALNFTGEGKTWELPAEIGSPRVVFSTQIDQPNAVVKGTLTLRADEGLILATG